MSLSPSSTSRKRTAMMRKQLQQKISQKQITEEKICRQVTQKLNEMIDATKPGSTRRKQIVKDLLVQFDKFPSLSYALYDVDIGLSTPIHCFLRAGEGIETIKDVVCKSCPLTRVTTLLKTRDIANNLPLHLACWYSSADIIEYLLQMMHYNKKELLFVRNDSGLTPLCCAMLNKSPSSRTIGLLLDKCSDSSSSSSSLNQSEFVERWDMSWTLALLSKQPTEILDLLVQQHPKTDTCLHINTRNIKQLRRGRLGNEPINLEQSKGISKLCHEIRSFSLDHQPGWECEAFESFIASLQDNHSLCSLEWITLPDLSSAKTTKEMESILTTFESFLEKNTHLEKLGIQLKECDAKIWHWWVEALERGMTKNQTIKRISFENWFTDDGGQTRRTILNIISQRETCLWMENFDFANINFIERLNLIPNFVDSLRLENGYPDQSTLSRTSPVTDIVRYLARAPALKRLEIEDYLIDVLPLFEALKTHAGIKSFCVDNSFLERFHRGTNMNDTTVSNASVTACLQMLQHNLNLEHCSPWNSQDPRIDFHLNHNKFVRGTLGPNATKTELVGLLVRLQAALGPSQQRNGRHCSSCLRTPMIGTWYRACNRSDYDLCEKCYQRYENLNGGREIQFEAVQAADMFNSAQLSAVFATLHEMPGLWCQTVNLSPEEDTVAIS